MHEVYFPSFLFLKIKYWIKEISLYVVVISAWLGLAAMPLEL